MIPVPVGGEREKDRGLFFSLLQIANRGSKIRSDKKRKGKGDYTAAAEAAGKLTVNMSVLPGPSPDTMPVPAVPASTVGVIDEYAGNV